MIKDIPHIKVEDLLIAIVPREDVSETSDLQLWDSYIINLKEENIKNVLINTTGYGEIGGEMRKTATFRYFFEEIPALGVVLIEPIDNQLFNLSHEFWVSFQFEGHLFDKKYIFVTGSIDPINFTLVPFLGRKGVMIR